MLAELTQVTNIQEDTYISEFLRLRLEAVQLGIDKESELSFVVRDKEWMEDAISCLNDQVQKHQLSQVMNISDLQLPVNFNFYHDPIAKEARLIFSPLASLQNRLRDIMSEYESPLLNEALFLSNYMMVTFNTKTTPLQKMLTGMELLLEKLDEWEAYASKKLNSCQEEIKMMKQLIIRYRKI